MRNLTLALLAPCVAALVAPCTASANDSSYGGCSGALSAVSSSDPKNCVPTLDNQVALVDEVLDIEATYKASHVVARYTFQNTGEATTLTVGFPIEAPSEGEGEPPTGNPLPDYAVTVDAKAAPFTVFIPGKDGTDEAKAAARRFAYDAVYLTEVPFAAGQTRVIEHRYTTGYSLIGYAYTPVRYLLRTGAHWKGGTIGKIAIRVRLAEPIAPLCLGAAFPGIKWDAATRTFTFAATGWKPRNDLLVTYAPADLHAHLAFAAEEGLNDLDEDPQKLGDADLESKVLALAPDLVKRSYVALLQAVSAALPAKRASRELCADGVKPITSQRDPTLRLSQLEPWLRRYLVAADAVLTARKVAHPPLPAQ